MQRIRGWLNCLQNDGRATTATRLSREKDPEVDRTRPDAGAPVGPVSPPAANPAVQVAHAETAHTRSGTDLRRFEFTEDRLDSSALFSAAVLDPACNHNPSTLAQSTIAIAEFLC